MTGVRDRIRASLRPEGDDDPLVGQARGLTIRQIVRRFLPMLRPLRWWLLLSLALVAAIPAIAVVEILLFQRVVDDVLVPADLDPLLNLALLYIALNVLSGILSGAEDYVSTYVSQSFLVGLRAEVFDRVVRQPALAFDKRRLGDTMTRLTSDITAVETFMVLQLVEGTSAVLRLVFVLGALLWLDWQLTLAALVIVPLFWAVARRFAALTKDVSRERRRRGGSLSSVTEESLANVSLVQAYGREADAVARYQRQNRAIMGAELAAARIRAVFTPVIDLAELIGILAVISLGVWALDADRLTLGQLLAFLTLLSQCYGPIRDLADLIPGLFSASAGVERVVELMDEAGADDTDRPALPARAVPGSAAIELRGVRVRYPGASVAALDGVDLRVGRGETVAIVGPSGSGKSTIARLLSRHVDAEAGRVLLDGHDVAAHSAASARSRVTPVLQEQLMLDASLRENIAYGRPDAAPTELAHATRAALVDDFVSRLPDGLDTRIGQRGRSLSGGQRQRVAVARALLRDTQVLILDEPTTGLDTETATRFAANLADATRGQTVLILTHDPSMLAHVDRVIAMADLNAAGNAPDDANTGEDSNARDDANARGDAKIGSDANTCDDANTGDEANARCRTDGEAVLDAAEARP